MKVINLNRREQVFAETHFGLTLDFIKDRGLSYRQFRDVVRIGYLVAVKLYHAEGLFHRESFEAFSRRYMQQAVCLVTDGIISGNGNSYALVVGQLLGDRNSHPIRSIQERMRRRFSHAPYQYRLSHTYTFIPGYRQISVGEVM